MSLITGPSSSYVVQKLISVLPSSDLEAIHEVILTNFLELSLDRSGCRIVQIMLEFSNESQQRQLTSMLCNPSIVMALACDASGTYVAQVKSLVLFILFIDSNFCRHVCHISCKLQTNCKALSSPCCPTSWSLELIPREHSSFRDSSLSSTTTLQVLDCTFSLKKFSRDCLK